MEIDIRKPVDELEQMFLMLPPAPCPVRHIYGEGVYMREVTMPADSFVIGHRQKGETLSMLVKGSGYLVGENGETMEVKAPFVWVAPPGRKLGYCREESVLVNVWNTTEQDVETLEDTYLDKSEAFKQRLVVWQAYQPLMLTDQSDYRLVLSELNVTEATARQFSEDETDLIPFPPGAYKIKIGKSPIEGKGVIATANINAGEMIAAARIGGKRTPAGRYANHSANPNATMIRMGDDFYLVAIADIKGCRGGFDGEEVTVNYRAAIADNVGAST